MKLKNHSNKDVDRNCPISFIILLKKDALEIEENFKGYGKMLLQLLICYTSFLYPKSSINPFRKHIEINCLGKVQKLKGGFCVETGEIKFTLSKESKTKAIEQLETILLFFKTYMMIADNNLKFESCGFLFFERNCLNEIEMTSPDDVHIEYINVNNL